MERQSCYTAKVIPGLFHSVKGIHEQQMLTDETDVFLLCIDN